MSTPATPDVSTATATSPWKVDPVHSNAQFKVKHMMISNVKGEFTGLRGTLTLDNTDITHSYVEASIDASTIATGDPQRDAHLKSADFFNVEAFPTLTFKSTRISKKGDDRYAVEGDLTIHGVTRKAVFEVEDLSAPAKDPWGNTRIGLSTTVRINRKDFGLTWNSTLETGGLLVGDEVTITLDVQFIKS
jgi:polyisoprenoid-binding protein YceI